MNSNPATIMTDKDIADKVYMEPLNENFLRKVLAIEKPDAILPSLGGQTGLNLAVKIAETGYLDREGIELIGCNLDTIKKAEDRELFKQLMHKLNEPTPSSKSIETIEGALEFAEEIGYPVIVSRLHSWWNRWRYCQRSLRARNCSEVRSAKLTYHSMLN